jgi:hypothetical protein
LIVSIFLHLKSEFYMNKVVKYEGKIEKKMTFF